MQFEKVGGGRYILHEFFADGTDFLGESGGEHHDLLMMWCRPENILNIPSHV
jgi:hypothetical protein